MGSRKRSRDEVSYKTIQIGVSIKDEEVVEQDEENLVEVDLQANEKVRKGGSCFYDCSTVSHFYL